jgi:NADH-quinone oxidoreductase subunit K
MIHLYHYLFLSGLLFFISLIGMIIHRKKIIHLLITIELMLLAISLNFITFSYVLHDITGTIFVFFIWMVSSAGMIIALAIMVSLFRKKDNPIYPSISQQNKPYSPYDS